MQEPIGEPALVPLVSLAPDLMAGWLVVVCGRCCCRAGVRECGGGRRPQHGQVVAAQHVAAAQAPVGQRHAGTHQALADAPRAALSPAGQWAGVCGPGGGLPGRRLAAPWRAAGLAGPSKRSALKAWMHVHNVSRGGSHLIIL